MRAPVSQLPGSPRKRRWPRRGATALLGLLLTFIVLVNGCTGWLARSIVWGANTDKRIDPRDDPSPEQLERLGVSRQMRVDVGPPSASLHLFVIDPAGEPRGTMLVLHGINDRKDTMVAFGKQLA